MNLNNNFHQENNSKYRLDIEGLRGIAVLSVVGFHAFPSLIRGGFIGVDIFFVISGFLISTILFEGLEKNKFSFLDFYSRRIKRIFPALLIVLFFCYVFGWQVLFSDEYKQLGKHILGGTSFSSNFLLWNESGYFDNSSDTKPLLHLWSLAIEEQFYLIWPLLLWLAHKLKIHFLLIIIIIFILSFSYNIFEINNDPVGTFYSPLTRIWELLIGALLAWAKLKNKTQNIQSFIGFAFIIIGFIVINEKNFPGWWALLPTIGTAFLISAGDKAWINRYALSNEILRWFGTISYPLYLWHWPLLSFLYIAQSGAPSPILRIIAVFMSIFLSWLTYKYIEIPIRFGNKERLKPIILSTLMLLIGIIGLNTFIRDGLQSRSIVKYSQDSGEEGNDEKKSINQCGISNETEKKVFAHCLSDSRETPKYALLGDSKAAALYGGLVRTSLEKGRWLFIGGSAKSITAPVPILTDNEIYKKYQIPSQIALRAISENKNIKDVVLVIAVRAIFQLDAYSVDNSPNNNYDTAYDGLNKAIDILLHSGKNIVILIDNPTLADPKNCIKRITKFHIMNNYITNKSNPDCEISIKNHLSLSQKYLSLIHNINLKNPDKIKIFDTLKYMCDFKNGICSSHKNGRLMYSYGDHISDYAAGLIGADLNKFLMTTPPS
ncbi:hypothetical protein AXG55_04395 [Silvanigrella aquatica]|uniref:Acyltransferase 3 domain-containing protein n=1 Tax=Silvanigrella aquatica TaxID=1915309 RepID=A0A1L4CZ09_9BACT|nr:hypothetical protein AXG55_04395 [Silvanigrella aquatica]